LLLFLLPKEQHERLPFHGIKKLRRINPGAARRAVLEYLKRNGLNISQGAQVFGINRIVIYDILRKERREFKLSREQIFT